MFGVGATTFLWKFIQLSGSPVLDKGHNLTFLNSDFDLSRFNIFKAQRKDFQLFGVPYKGLDDFEIVKYEKIFLRRKNNLKTIEKKLLKASQKYQFCYFLTMTFRDDFLNSTSAAYRRDQISRFLKRNFCSYVGNIDFGDLRDREHYHAVAFTDVEIFGSVQVYGSVVYINSDSLDYPYGYVSLQPVSSFTSDSKALSKYLNKLKFHSAKDSTKFLKPIFSRKDL